jgi:hypothetical protein
VLWKALQEHDPTKLDSTPNSNSTASDDFPKIKYTQCHFNYYCNNKNPKIAKPVPLGSQYVKAPLRIGITHFHSIKLQIWIFEGKVTRSINLNTSISTRVQIMCN